MLVSVAYTVSIIGYKLPLNKPLVGLGLLQQRQNVVSVCRMNKPHMQDTIKDTLKATDLYDWITYDQKMVPVIS